MSTIPPSSASDPSIGLIEAEPPNDPSRGGYPHHEPGFNYGLGAGALATGIIGLVLGGNLILFAYYVGPVLGLVLGIVAVTLGRMSHRRAPQGRAADGGLALAGMILGVASVVGSTGLGILNVWWLSSWG